MANALVDILVPILKDIKNTRYSELASSSIIIYDYSLTLDQEIQYIWKARWTIGKVLFFVNRYYTLFVVVFNNFALFSPTLTDDLYVTQLFGGGYSDNSVAVGLHWFKWQGWTGLIAAALAETILQLRLYALYYGNKKVLALMAGFFVSAMAASAVIMGSTLRNVQASSNLIPGTKFCIVTSALPHFYAFWIPILGFETLLCVLACIRGYRSYKDHEIRRLGKTSPRRRPTSLQPESKRTSRELNMLEILLRDSVGYFIVIFATYFTTAMIWILGPIPVMEIPVGFTVALSSVITNRLLLNLRGSHVRDVSGNAHNPDMSSQGVCIGTASHMTSVVGVTTTIEDEQGREIAGYELQALRNLRAST